MPIRMTVKHPAKFSDPIIDVLLEETASVVGVALDPFAGTGKVHRLQRKGLRTVGIEIEPEWAGIHPQTVVGNALHLPFPDNAFDAIVTSPCYGNRMADSHNAQDDSHRNTYTHVLGRKLHDDNAGAMQWGDKYRHFHLQAWMEAYRVLKPERGKRRRPMIVNISNHIRNGEEIDVTGWHISALQVVGFKLQDVRTVQTTRNRDGSNGDLRCPFESVLVLSR
jgi:SAM-dependent methyltransferase